MKYRPLIIYMLLLSWVSVKAQLNESDTVKFQLRTSLTGNYQQGNVNILTVRSKLDFSFSPVKDFVFKSQNSSLYQEFSSKKADNDIFSRNFIYYKPQKKIYPFGIAYISTNYRRKIDTRLFTGAGLTYRGGGRIGGRHRARPSSRRGGSSPGCRSCRCRGGGRRGPRHLHPLLTRLDS